jgi:CHAT domain-containing protein
LWKPLFSAYFGFMFVAYLLFYNILMQFKATIFKTLCPGLFLFFCFSAFGQTISLKDSINFYYSKYQYRKALPFAELLRDQIKNEKGINSEEFGKSLNTIGDILNRSGKSKDAEPILIQALDVLKLSLGESNSEIGLANYNLGVSYWLQHNNKKAEPLIQTSLDIRKKVLGENHKDVGKSFEILGTINKDLSNYQKAETNYLKTLEIYKKVLPADDREMAGIFHNLGTLYRLMGAYSKSESNHSKALEIRKKTMGENHVATGQSYAALASVSSSLGDFIKAEKYSLLSLEIQEKTLGENHPNIGLLYVNQGSFYKGLGNNEKAEHYFLKGIEIQKKVTGEESIDVGNSLFNLGQFNSELGNFYLSEKLLLKSLDIRVKNWGKDHSDVGNSYNHMGKLYWNTGNIIKAEANFLLSKQNYLNQIQRNFPFMSDTEKESFFETLKEKQHDFTAFCISRQATNPAITGELFNQQLATKALLLNSSAKWKHRIKNSGDKKLFRMFDEWESNQNTMAKLALSPDPKVRAGIDSIQLKTEKLEKELSLRSENFSKLSERTVNTWKDIQNKLKPGEAALEIIRFKGIMNSKPVKDTSDPKKPIYRIKTLSDSIQYVALIVKPGLLHPEMVVLRNGDELETKFLSHYKFRITNRSLDELSYNQFWKKINAKLTDVKTIYFSPDGVYHSINLNTIWNPISSKYLLEEKDIRLITATKDLIHGVQEEDVNKLAYLIGFPNYYQNSAPTNLMAKEESRTPQLTYGLNLDADKQLAELPGTKIEVEKMQVLLTSNGWDAQALLAENALEGTLKEFFKPRLLHIATHGYFQPDTNADHNPLLRSGLMLAGAGNTIKGQNNSTGDDGILTAYEAMNLNLDNTDLVILSACETGMGEVKNGEGVYGLQRAFKVAGAKTLVMSLWKVSDDATQELMVAFCKNWLETGNKRSAFSKAQKTLKTKFTDPYFWGAFVMVGE